MKRILITGAASGLGLAMAKKYASEGWAVCIADIQDEEGAKVASDLKNQHDVVCVRVFVHGVLTPLLR